MERKRQLPAHLSKVPNSDLPSSNQPENKQKQSLSWTAYLSPGPGI